METGGWHKPSGGSRESSLWKEGRKECRQAEYCSTGRHNTQHKTTDQHRSADTWRINRETNEEGNEGDTGGTTETIMRWQDGRGQTIDRKKHMAQHKHNISHVPKTILCPLVAILGTPAEDHDKVAVCRYHRNWCVILWILLVAKLAVTSLIIFNFFIYFCKV